MRWARLASAFALLASVIAGGLTSGAVADAAPTPTFAYATMPDGTQIAVVVSFPRRFSHAHRWPALLMVDGYEGGGGALDPAEWRNHYVVVHASVRGTGCSGGHFDLFDRATAYDGHDLIDRWIPSQPWSNGRVGLVGHSYPGLTGFAIAETAPKHLEAVALSGLIDDLYSGESYPGGVPNGGFTLLWTLGERPFSEQTGNLTRYATPSQRLSCLHNIATRPPPDVADDPVVNGATTMTRGEWWSTHSLVTNVGGVRAPTMITQQYQDEQTGPQGGFMLWKSLPRSVPKRLVLTNGVHATNEISRFDARRWLDCWMLSRGPHCGAVTDPRRRVSMHFETTGPGNNPFVDHVNPSYDAPDYPDPQTRWVVKHLHGSYVSLPAGRQTYLSGAGVADALGSSVTPEQTLDGAFGDAYGPVTTAAGPDRLEVRVRFRHTVALAGPVPVTMWMSSSAPDTDVFVQLVDEGPDGARSFLQRGMLRASLRAVDTARSLTVASGRHTDDVYWWSHPFTNRRLLTPSALYQVRLDVPPVGAVLRPGHTLVVQIYAPPPVDELNAYGSAQPPALNTIVDTARHPSTFMLPLLPRLPSVATKAPACGSMTGIRCTTPLAAP